MKRPFEYETLHVDDFKPLMMDTADGPKQVFALDAVPYIVVDLDAVQKRENALCQERIARSKEGAR
jgi:hypothetical protein